MSYPIFLIEPPIKLFNTVLIINCIIYYLLFLIYHLTKDKLNKSYKNIFRNFINITGKITLLTAFWIFLLFIVQLLTHP